MKILRVMTCVLFFSIIMVPVLLFNFEEGVISEIDNRELAQNPFLKEKVEWGMIPYVQAMLLARYLRGDLDGYPPFLWK